MRRMRIKVSAVINAGAEDIYALLADYREGHPRILPEENFRDVEVEAGGRGAGTVICYRSVAGRGERRYRMSVTEPEPGRVLVESSTTSTPVTTLTVMPLNGRKQARVEIAADIDAYSGLRGLAQRALCPPAIRHIYRKELRLLAAVMAPTPDPFRFGLNDRSNERS